MLSQPSKGNFKALVLNSIEMKNFRVYTDDKSFKNMDDMSFEKKQNKKLW